MSYRCCQAASAAVVAVCFLHITLGLFGVRLQRLQKSDCCLGIAGRFGRAFWRPAQATTRQWHAHLSFVRHVRCCQCTISISPCRSALHGQNDGRVPIESLTYNASRRTRSGVCVSCSHRLNSPIKASKLCSSRLCFECGIWARYAMSDWLRYNYVNFWQHPYISKRT